MAFKGYSELQKVSIKARGVELLTQFLADPKHLKIPLSTGLSRVATGWVEDPSATESEAGSTEELLEPMPLPGKNDTFDYEEECFE